MYHLQVMTPEQIIFDDEVNALIAPGEEGYLGILTGHAPLLASLKLGTLIITENSSKKSYYKISAGFLEVKHNQASIIIDSIQPIASVDLGIETYT